MRGQARRSFCQITVNLSHAKYDILAKSCDALMKRVEANFSPRARNRTTRFTYAATYSAVVATFSSLPHFPLAALDYAHPRLHPTPLRDVLCLFSRWNRRDDGLRWWFHDNAGKDTHERPNWVERGARDA